MNVPEVGCNGCGAAILVLTSGQLQRGEHYLLVCCRQRCEHSMKIAFVDMQLSCKCSQGRGISDLQDTLSQSARRNKGHNWRGAITSCSVSQLKAAAS